MKNRKRTACLFAVCALLLLNGCERAAVQPPSSSSSQAASSSEPAEAIAPVSSSDSVPEDSSSVEASVPESSAIAESSSAPQTPAPAPSPAPSEKYLPPISEREYVPGRIPSQYDPNFSPDDMLLASDTQAYRNEIRSALPASDYAYIVSDEISGVIAIYTMTPEKVLPVLEKIPNELIEVLYFTAECTREELNNAIEEIKSQPFIQKNKDKLYGVFANNLPEKHGVIEIRTNEDIPGLAEWVEQYDCPFEIEFSPMTKDNPA